MNTYTIRIKRFNPEYPPKGTPHTWWQDFTIELSPTDQLIDALINIKDEQDGSLTFRRSCAHGVCGSCAMKINGKNALACQTLLKDMPPVITIEPLQEFDVLKDLVVDMEPFFAKNLKVMPWLINNDPPPERERLQSPSDQKVIEQSITCVMCGSCTSSCPVYWYDKQYLGPSALLKAARFTFDTRDQATDERLKKITGRHGLYRCHSIYNCVECCPKHIDITSYIAKLKNEACKRKI